MKSYIHLLLTLAAINYVYCQDSLITYSLDEIVVSDNSSINAVPTLTFRETTINIDKNYRLNSRPVLQLADQLNAGVFVSARTNLGYGIGPNSGGGITIRGIGSSPNTQVLLLINGEPQFMGLMGHPLPDSYNSEEVSQVQVVKGPASALFGSGAMGGVINIITKKTYGEGIGLSVSSSYGSFNTLKYGGEVDYGVNDFNASFLYKNESTDGHRPNSGFDMSGYSLNLRKVLNNNFYFRVSSSIDDYTIHDPGTVDNPLNDSYADVLRGAVEMSISNQFSSTDGKLSIFHNFGEHKISDGFRSTDFSYGGRFFQNIEFDNGATLSGGFDYTAYGGEAENISADVNFGDHSISQYGLYLNAIYPVNSFIRLNGTIRLDNNSQFGSIFTPQGGIEYLITDQLTARLFFSKGYRNPTIRELYLFPFPTPGLNPENLWNYETGISYNPSEYFEIDLNLYYAEGSNLIQVTGAPPNLTYSNSGNFLNKGLEAAAKFKSGSFYNVVISTSIIDPDKITASFPQQSFSGIFEFDYRNLKTMISVEHNQEIYGANNFLNRLDDFTLVNLDIYYDLARYLSLGLQIENLTDEEYEILPGYPMPGFTINGNVKIKMDFN